MEPKSVQRSPSLESKFWRLLDFAREFGGNLELSNLEWRCQNDLFLLVSTKEHNIINQKYMEVEAEKVRKAFDKFKALLNAREVDVITRYYGISPNVRNSLAEIGKRYGVTRERVRQIKVIALNKLKVKN